MINYVAPPRHFGLTSPRHSEIVPPRHSGLDPESQKGQQVTNAKAPYKIYNIGNNQPVTLRRFITAIETACGKKAKQNLLPMQPGDVPITYADVDDLIKDTGFKPSTSIEDGIAKFVEWYKEYYK